MPQLKENRPVPKVGAQNNKGEGLWGGPGPGETAGLAPGRPRALLSVSHFLSEIIFRDGVYRSF